MKLPESIEPAPIMPTREQMKKINGLLRPDPDGHGADHWFVYKKDIIEPGFSEDNLRLLPIGVFDGTCGNKLQFFKTGVQGWLGIGKGREI